jgi:Flp pilus assembly protein TadG
MTDETKINILFAIVAVLFIICAAFIINGVTP